MKICKPLQGLHTEYLHVKTANHTGLRGSDKLSENQSNLKSNYNRKKMHETERHKKLAGLNSLMR